MATPPLPPGYKLGGKPKGDPDLFKPLLDTGVEATNGYRAPGDTQRLKRQGYKPASNSEHLDGDGVDLIPGKSGLTLGQLRQRADVIARGWPGARVINEGNHVHAQLPGWGMAPGTPGTKYAGIPPLPSGAKLVQRGALRQSDYRQSPNSPLAGLSKPTGRVHDGDTFRLSTGSNARLLGVDAFELKQQGMGSKGAVPIGQDARNALMGFAVPRASFTANGTQTFGRPVGTLNNGADAGRSILDQGLGWAAPQYLKADPARLRDYMEAERLARLNRRGAFQTTHLRPEAERAGDPDPWAKPEESTDGKGTAYFWDEPTPFQGLRPEIEQGYLAALNADGATAGDVLRFAADNGFSVDASDVSAFLKNKAKGIKSDGKVNYGAAPRVLTDPGDGKLGVTLRGVADPVNLLDEMGGVVDTLGGTKGRENLWNSDRRFGDIWNNNIDQNRSILAHDEATHPYYRLGGQLGGALVIPGGAGVRTVGGLAKLGAVEGGLAGFGAGETMRERLTYAPLGAMAGATGGAALGSLGNAAAAGVRRWRGKGSGDAVEGVAQEAAPILNNGIQNAGPTPAARYQPQRAAMAMDDGGPVLVGPAARQPDYIDAGDLPPLPEGYSLSPPLGASRPIGEPLDASAIANLGEGVDPASVLPRPGNVVTSLEEAMKANPGPFRNLTAPDEFAALRVRALPSNRDLYRSTKVRGPLDMTQALRRLGGVKDDGGELAHLGIDGFPRRLPFGGGEQFLGRLINNEGGMPLDEATHKLWEMGYFPHLRDRPTPDDLLDALQQESTGANRFFHPDDWEEVAGFEAAQAERGMIEQAEASGSPLVEDIGHSITLDDLERKRPPASAYEDRPRITGKLGNINLDRLEKPEDVAQLIDQVQKRVGGFDAASRGKITHDETRALADELGLTPEQLLKRRPGQAINAEEAYASRVLVQKSREVVGKLAQKAVGGGDEDLLAFRKAWIRHVALEEQAAGVTAEAGRLLSQFRMVARGADARSNAVRDYLRGAGGRESIEDAAQKIVDLMEDPARAGKFIRDAVKPGMKDKLTELYINALLSGPQTHAVNIVSNAMTAALSIPEHAAAAALGAFRGGTDRVMGSELGARVVGLMQGATDGLKLARKTFKTGEVTDMVTKIDARHQEAIGGTFGHIARTPTRLLAAEDEVFKGAARRSELAALAVRKAHAEGLKGDPFKARVAELTSNPDDAMMAQANDFARYQTFQRPVGDIAGGLLKASNAHPWLKLIVPFVRTPTNILKYAGERSPIAPLLKDWRADFMAGGARRDLAIARSTLGTGLGLTVMQLAQDGLITGGGPADANAKRIKLADGWQPYSIKLGDTYYSYQRLDPLATTIGVAADYVDKQSAMTDRQRDESAMLLTASIIQNLSDKTWLSGLSDFISALNDPMRGGPPFIRKTIAGAVTPAAMGQLARTIDDTPRETKTVRDAIQARIPGLSDNLRPRLDAWGRPMKKEGGVGPDITSPFYQSTGRNEAINREALRLNLKVSDPSRIVGGKRLSDAQFHDYRMLAGQMAARTFGELIASPGYREMTNRQQQDAFDDLKKTSRETARNALGLGGGSATTPPPPPGRLPPLPPGATLPPLPPGATMGSGPR